jgi:hypothetical protein
VVMVAIFVAIAAATFALAELIYLTVRWITG